MKYFAHRHGVLLFVGTIAISTCFASLACAQTTATLQTSDTIVQVRAAKNAPQFLSVSDSAKRLWANATPASLIEFVYVSDDLAELKKIPIKWTLNNAASHADQKSVSFVYDSDSPKLRLAWEWSVAADFGPLEHQIHIENRDTREFWLPLQSSFSFDFQIAPATPLGHLYIEKGGDTPGPIGTHEIPLAENCKWEGFSSPYGDYSKGALREIIPYFLVHRTDSKQGGWFVGIESSARTRLALEREQKSLRGEVGLNPNPGSFRTLLQPGQLFDAPKIFIGAFSESPEEAGNILRRWVRQTLNNPVAWQNPNYPILVNNSWGSGMQVDEALAHRMIRDSSELGLEMFHMDAGWFRGVGDWQPNPQKFPHGIAAIADGAHKNNLKFGLWVDWTQAGLSAEPGALNVRDPGIRDWLVSDPAIAWMPEPFKGRTIDIGAPAAQDWAEREAQRIVADYHLDMLEHDGYLIAKNCDRRDHPHAALSAGEKSQCGVANSELAECANSTDVSYHAVRAYYDIQSSLRRQHPDLFLEICNDGGRLVDFGSAAHGDYFSITDTYDPLSNRRAFYDTSHVLPAAMLETYVERWPAPRIENFRYMLRSGMMGWLSIMQDTTVWLPEQHAAAKEEFRLYKEKLRPLIRDANLYHISPRPDGIHWDAIEYFDVNRGTGVIYAFRGSIQDEPNHTFFLQGLDPNSEYRLHFQDGSDSDRTVKGEELMKKGLTINLAQPNDSELVFIDVPTNN